MNILRYFLLSALLATSAQHVTAVTEEELSTSFEALVTKHSQTLKELNGGYDIIDLNHGVVKFIRDNAEKIGKELEYLVDHEDAQTSMLLGYEVNKVLVSFENCLKNVTLSDEQTVANLLQEKNVALFLVDLIAFWNSTKKLTLQTLPVESCPILHQAITQLATLETIAMDFIPLLSQYPQNMPVNMLKKNIAHAVQVVPAMRKVYAAYFDYMKTPEHAMFAKNVITTWVAFMKEDAFFEMLQSNQKASIDAGTKPQPFFVPETLKQYLAAVELYVATQHNAVYAQLDEESRELLQMQAPVVTGTGDEELNFIADAGVATECTSSCSSDDCVEYDFAQMRKK